LERQVEKSYWRLTEEELRLLRAFRIAAVDQVRSSRAIFVNIFLPTSSLFVFVVRSYEMRITMRQLSNGVSLDYWKDSTVRRCIAIDKTTNNSNKDV
jgi:hypothetical protein